MLSPKGAGFLHARPEVQHLVEPLVVGWGWGPFSEYSAAPPFVNQLQWLGTNDLSAYLSVPAAIEFMEQHDWEAVRGRCHRLLVDALRRVNDLTGKASIYPNEDDFFVQMGVAELPRITDLKHMKKQLIEAYRVEVPLVEWNGRHFIRISVQGYNTEEDLDALVLALRNLLPFSN